MSQPRRWVDSRPYTEIVLALTQERKEMRLSQRDVAALVGVGQSTIARMEASGRATERLLHRYAVALGGTAHLIVAIPGSEPLELDVGALVRSLNEGD